MRSARSPPAAPPQCGRERRGRAAGAPGIKATCRSSGHPGVVHCPERDRRAGGGIRAATDRSKITYRDWAMPARLLASRRLAFIRSSVNSHAKKFTGECRARNGPGAAAYQEDLHEASDR